MTVQFQADVTTTFQMLTVGRQFIRLADVGDKFTVPLLVRTTNGAICLTGPNKGLPIDCPDDLQVRAIGD